MPDVQHVLEQYGVQAKTIRPLENTQNTNHTITDADGSRYLLRQHRQQHTALEIESELIWLQYLHSQGLEVQQPISLESGTLVLEDEGKRFSLLSWLEGEVLETTETSQAEAVGVLMGRLHQAARNFNPPESFTRPRYDAERSQRILETLKGIAWLIPDLPLLEAASHHARHVFNQPSEPPYLIHGDLHAGNLIWNAGQVSVIDFDACGFGPLGLDVATALGYLEEDARANFLRGYTSVLPLPEGFDAQRHLFTINEWLDNLSFLAQREHEREYLETVFLPGLREQLPKLMAR